MDYLNLPQSNWLYYVVDFIIILVIVAGFRLFANNVTRLDKQLAEDDNFAVGIALSGAMLGIAIMLMGASSGKVAPSLGAEAFYMTTYGLLGVLLMALTRKIFDTIALPHISIQQQIQQHNVAAGLIDAGNMIASAIIIRAVMLWVDDDSLWGLLWVLAGFVASQLIMYIVTLYRRVLFKRRHRGHTLEQEIKNGNIALAVRFSGHRIGVALAITVTSNLVIYQAQHLVITLLLWIGVALLLFLAQTLVSVVVRQVFLSHINLGAEIIEQKNVALGALQAAIYIAVGLIFVGLLG